MLLWGWHKEEIFQNQEHPMNWNSKFKIRLRVTFNFLRTGAGSFVQFAALRAQCWCLCKSDTEWVLERCKVYEMLPLNFMRLLYSHYVFM